MAIVYYPNRVYKEIPPAIDRVRTMRDPMLIRGRSNVASTALDVVISPSTGNWNINSIKFTFDSATARDYSAKILGGRKVVTNLNDYLWFQHTNSLWQKITLSAGFYTGTELATELQTQLNANTEFTSLGITFTVAYDSATGLFTITPSSGELRYIDANNTQQLSDRQSIAGHLFGLTTDSAFGATVVSDTEVYGLGEEAAVIDASGSVVTEHYQDDLHVLNEDQALHLASSVAAVIINYEICYEDMV